MRAIAGLGLTSQIDAGRAAPGSLLLSQLWAPTPLSPDEEDSHALVHLARRHAPAMALANPDIWPVDVSYAWHDGSAMVARARNGQSRVVLTAAELRDPKRFHAAPPDDGTRYYVDVPGSGQGQAPLSWRGRWRAIQKNDEPATAAYPPTQHVHGFWLNRKQGLLALQYWFFYPFNDWVNVHEGDWEHIVVVLRGPRTLDDADAFAPVSHLYYFHEWIHEPERLIQLGGPDPREAHPVVFVGGRGDLWNLWHCERPQSGGSYPWPGRYGRVGTEYRWFSPSEKIGSPRRFLAPEAFRLVMLPEPDRVTASHHPELWWMRWPLFLGQRHVAGNLPTFSTLGLDHPPSHPGRHRDWNASRRFQTWPGQVEVPLTPHLPVAWQKRRLTSEAVALRG